MVIFKASRKKWLTMVPTREPETNVLKTASPKQDLGCCSSPKFITNFIQDFFLSRQSQAIEKKFSDNNNFVNAAMPIS